MTNKFHKAVDTLLEVWKSEYKAIFQDRGVMLLFFGAGIIYPLLYSAAYSTEVANNVAVAVVDADQSSYSRQLTRMIDASQQVAVSYKANSLAEAQQLFNTNKVRGVLVIEEGFGRKILRSESATVAVYADASYFVLYKQVLAGTKIAALTYGAGIEITRMQAQGVGQQQAINNRAPIGFKGIALYNPSGGYGSYAMPAVLLLVLQQTLLLGIGMLGGTQHEFKKHSSHMQTALKNGGAGVLVLGKALAYFTLYLFLFVFVMVLVFRWFDFPHRADVLSLFVFTVPFLLAAIFLGISLANFFTHRETSILLLLCTTLPFVFMSGLSWPVEAMPAVWKAIAHAVPSSAGVRGLLQLNTAGVPFYKILNYWLELWLLAVVYFIAAVRLTKWRARRWQRHTRGVYRLT